jgi:hypothetical protein
MKTYEIILANGHIYRVEGMIINVDENTGRSIIYSENNPIYVNIVAVIPSDASVWVVS